MNQLRMFRLAPEAFAISAHYVPGEGWICVVSMRRGDETWADAYRADYAHLTSAELVDVVDAEAAELLRGL